MEKKGLTMEKWCCYISLISFGIISVLCFCVLLPVLLHFSYDSLEIVKTKNIKIKKLD